MRNAQTFQHMEMPPLRLETCLLRMETPLRGRSGGHTGAAPTISRMACVIRFSENSSPRHKHKCIVVASCSPLHKKEFIVAANSSPLH